MHGVTVRCLTTFLNDILQLFPLWNVCVVTIFLPAQLTQKSAMKFQPNACWSILLPLILLSDDINAQTCTVCRGGEPITRPDQTVVIPPDTPVPIEDCATLARYAPFFRVDSPECAGIQQLGYICGCNPPDDDENACRLCPGGDHHLPHPKRQVDIELEQYLPPDLGEPLGEIISSATTCESFDAILMSETADSALCRAFRQVRSACECPDEVTVVTTSKDSTETCPVCDVANPNGTLVNVSDPITSAQLATCGELVDAAKLSTASTSECSEYQDVLDKYLSDCGGCLGEDGGCQICPNGYHLKNQSVLLSTADALPANDCRQLEAIAQSLDSTQCLDAQSFIADCGGCVKDEREASQAMVPDEACTLCPFGEPVPFPGKTFDFMQPVPDCGTLDLAAGVYPKESQSCADLRAFSAVCGCVMPESSCRICGDRPMTRPNAKHKWFHQGILASSRGDNSEETQELLESYISCEVMDSFMGASETADSDACYSFQLRGASCGCPDRRATLGLALKRIFSGLSLMVSDVGDSLGRYSIQGN